MSLLSPTEMREILSAIGKEISPDIRNKLEAWQGTVVEVGSGAQAEMVRVARRDEPTTAVDLLRNWYPVIGTMPAVTDEVWALSWYGSGLVLTGGSGGSGSALTGEVKMWAGATTPTGYLPCDGAAVSRTTYAALYTALGAASSPYGQGDGSTTFNVPDYRGRVPVGVGTGDASGATAHTLGEKEGQETVTLAISQMPLHNHTWSADTNTNTTQTGSGNRLTVVAQGNAGSSDAITTSEGGGGSHTNLQPSLGTNFIIKT